MLKFFHTLRGGSMIASGLEYIGKLTPEERKYIEAIRNLSEEQQKELFLSVEKQFNGINKNDDNK